MTDQERINQINEAKELIIEAQALVDDAVKGTSQQNRYEAYGRYGFDTLLKNGNPYDDGLDDLIKDFQELADEESEAENE